MDESQVVEDLGVMRPIDAAVRLGVSIGTIYTMIRAGELPCQMVVLPGKATAQRMIPVAAIVAREAQR